MGFELIILLIVLMGLSAFFSGSEMAFVALNKLRLRHMMEKNVKGAKSAWDLIHRMDQLITTILICNNLVNTAIAAIGAVIFVRLFGEKWGIMLSTIAITLALLVFCEITPKIYATYHAERITTLVAYFMRFMIFIFRPIAYQLTKFSNLLIRLTGGKPGNRSPLVTEEEIKLMVKMGREAGLYEEQEKKMLDRIFHFDEIIVKDVMVPIEKVVMVSANETREKYIDTFLEKGHSRLPIYEKDRENVVAIFYVEGLLYLIQNPNLFQFDDLTTEPYFVSGEMKINHLLKEFQKRKLQIAIVQKDGKAIGLVTLEDLIEEIVGEIEEQNPI